jgi:hypothetical protein
VIPAASNRDTFSCTWVGILRIFRGGLVVRSYSGQVKRSLCAVQAQSRAVSNTSRPLETTDFLG